MHERLTERASGTVISTRLYLLSHTATVLDDRIDEFAELVREHYKLEDIGDPASTSDVCLSTLAFFSLLNSIQEEQVVVGRVCSEEDAKLKDTTIILETSRLMGAGARVPLKFNAEISMNGNKTIYPIFPGEIVGLKGRNETGDWFQVSEILPVCIRELVELISD